MILPPRFWNLGCGMLGLLTVVVGDFRVVVVGWLRSSRYLLLPICRVILALDCWQTSRGVIVPTRCCWVKHDVRTCRYLAGPCVHYITFVSCLWWLTQLLRFEHLRRTVLFLVTLLGINLLRILEDVHLRFCMYAKKAKQLDSLCWFANVVDQQHIFGVRTQWRAMTPNSNLAEIFCTVHLPPSLIILCLLVRKLSCWQTNEQTDAAENMQCCSLFYDVV